MLHLETTATCPRTPIILFAVEELGVACPLVVREPGYFQTHHHTAGPALVDGTLVLLELDTVLRHLARTRGAGTLMPSDAVEVALVDRWMELLASLRMRAAAAGAAAGAAPLPDETRAGLERSLVGLEAALDGRDHLLGRFTVADCGAVALSRLAQLGIDLARFPRLAGYVERLVARPAWHRAVARARTERAQAGVVHS